MAKQKSRKSVRRAKPACKARVARKCKKPRFTAACRAVLKSCIRQHQGESFRTIGKTCMPKLHACMRGSKGAAAIRKYKKAK